MGEVNGKKKIDKKCTHGHAIKMTRQYIAAYTGNLEMFKFVFRTALRDWQHKNLASPFSGTIALLCCSKNTSPEPFAFSFRLQNQNVNKLLIQQRANQLKKYSGNYYSSNILNYGKVLWNRVSQKVILENRLT
jgi:hypothetical protein